MRFAQVIGRQGMLSNYFKVAVRNLLRNKLFSIINIAGLAVGIASCLAILTFVRDDFSYDKFNKNSDRIYRAAFAVRVNGHGFSGPASPAPLGPQVAHDVPDVVAYTRLYLAGSHTVAYNNKAFNEEKFFWADSTIFDVFTIRVIEGDPKTALTQPNTIVMNQSTALKYFGKENPLGKVVTVDRQNDYVVTGVFKDFPRNSHFHPDFIASLTTLADSRNTAWLTNNYYTYFLLRSGTNLGNFQGKIEQEVTDHVASQLKEFTGTSYKDFMAAGNRYGFRLQPLTSIHLTSPFGEIEPGGYAPLDYVFIAIAIAILLIATINFVNLATARSAKRAKEVGVRKSLGAHRSRLLGQFLAESILMTAISVVMAVVIIELFLPLFSDIVGRKMGFDLFADPLLVPVLVGFIVVVGIVAGIYPAFYLSSSGSSIALRSGATEGRRKSRLRNALVVSQFAASIILIIATLVIYSQMGYVKTANIGFQKAGLLVLNGADHLSGQFQSFMRELGGNKNVMSLSNSSAVPSHLSGNHAYRLEGSGSEQPENTCVLVSDNEFAKTYQLKMAEGRFFSAEHPSDTGAVVVNETLAKFYGIKNMIGRRILFPGPRPKEWVPFNIIGVVKDFNYAWLHEPIRPLAIILPRYDGYVGSCVTARLAPDNQPNGIAAIQSAWKKYAGNEPLNYSFLDEDLHQLYSLDFKTEEIVGLFSALAIIIACLGLFGLAAFTTEQRTKEIGIRKVLGASAPEVTKLLSLQFAKWVLIANIAAWPLAYLLMSKWLSLFAYRTSLSPWLFVASGALALVIALVTVSSHAIKAATANPVEALRYE